jgi:arylsulfatase
VPHWNLQEEQLKQQIDPGEVAHAIAWTGLNQEERRFQATKMAIHAAMVDRMDREIGRLLDQIKAMGALEKTIVLFASDNGASAEFLNRGDMHDNSAALGSGGSYLCLGPGWSTAANTPFRLHKSWVHEGGIATPFIVRWPKGIAAKGEWRRTPAHVIDFVPTVLEIVGAKPEKSGNGVEAPPLPGRSLVPTFTKDANLSRDYLFFHHEQNRALRIGEWKLVSKRPDTNDYALYNLNKDRCEQVNLAVKEKDRVASMARRWRAIEDELRRLAGPLSAGGPERNQ